MGRQTFESLLKEKLIPYRHRGYLTEHQFLRASYICNRQGFWEALGYTTRTKHRNIKLLTSGVLSEVAGNPKPDANLQVVNLCSWCKENRAATGCGLCVSCNGVNI